MAAATKGIPPTTLQLFQDVEKTFASTQLGQRWYILVLSALVGGNEPEMADQLYLYLISKPECQESHQRQALVRRLRETLLKLVSLIGVCKPIEAILAIKKVEREEDRDYSFSRKDWKCDDGNLDRGMHWFQQIYAGNIDDTLALFDAHKDFQWVSKNITYGLYLSDRQILDDSDTELLTLVGIMIQNLPIETHWHIRGARRIGISKEDVKTIVSCVGKVAEFMGVKQNRIPSVEEVEKDV
jgi:hypothetical protein